MLLTERRGDVTRAPNAVMKTQACGSAIGSGEFVATPLTQLATLVRLVRLVQVALTPFSTTLSRVVRVGEHRFHSVLPCVLLAETYARIHDLLPSQLVVLFLHLFENAAGAESLAQRAPFGAWFGRDGSV